MKESTLIKNFKLGEAQRLQNNQMIGGLANDLGQLQQMVSGFLGVIRKMPGYDEAIKELAAEHEAKIEKEKADAILAAKEEEKQAEEPKKLDLGKDD